MKVKIEPCFYKVQQMEEEKIRSESFDTFYASREESNCPLIPKIVSLGTTLKENNIIQNGSDLLISLGYGWRMLIHTHNIDFDEVKKDEFLEIVDYDPAKKVVLAIGLKNPPLETPVHWIVQNARKDVNTLVEIKNKELLEKNNNEIPVVQKKEHMDSLDIAKQVLKNLRDSNCVLIKDHGIFFAGENLKEVEKMVLKHLQ